MDQKSHSGRLVHRPLGRDDCEVSDLSQSDIGVQHKATGSGRNLVGSTGATALSVTVLTPQCVRAYKANSKINIGVIGCGVRGTWIAGLFRQHGGYRVAAGADYFQDKVDNFGNKLDVDDACRYTGLKSYMKLIEKVDAVAIESPPYFHPEQAAAAVDAGRHVYIAKPIAVDVPGCLSIEETGRRASIRKLCFLVDFQTRADPYFIEAVDRVHRGAIGRFAFGEASYHQEESVLDSALEEGSQKIRPCRLAIRPKEVIAPPEPYR